MRIFCACFFALIGAAALAAQPQVDRPFPDGDIPAGQNSDEAPPAPPPAPTVEAQFAEAVHAAIHEDAIGYSLIVLKGHEKLIERNYGLAKSVPDGKEFWTADTPMHVASTSKFITAIAVSRLFAANGIMHPDARPQQLGVGIDALPTLSTTLIADYLPDYWDLGPGVDAITIGDLLSHRSNLGCSNPATADQSLGTSLATARSAIETGTGTPCSGFDERYKNLNYTLLRIIMATASGLSTSFSPANCCECEPPVDDPLDCAWDRETTRRYVSYVQSQVFRIANIHRADVVARPRSPNYYRHQSVFTPGISGNEDFTGVKRTKPDEPPYAASVGPIGWIITPSELARLARAVTTPHLLLAPAQLQELKDEEFTLRATSTGSAILHGFGGTWGREASPALPEFDAITMRAKNWFYLGPNDTVIVLFSNSEVDGARALRDAYSLHPVGLN